MISDVRDSNTDVPLAVLALPPKPKTFEYDELLKLYEQKTGLYRELGATILGEQYIKNFLHKNITKMSLLMEDLKS